MFEEIYFHPDLIKTCKNIGGDEWEDIRGEVVAKIMTLPEDEKAKINNMLAFTIRSCYYYGLDFKKKSKPVLFTNLHIPYEDFITSFISDMISDDIASLSNLLKAKIESDCDNAKRFYHARVWVYCNQCGSIAAFSKKTKIPYRVLARTYGEYRTYLTEWLKSHI